jgi:hypothetical protein
MKLCIFIKDKLNNHSNLSATFLAVQLSFSIRVYIFWIIMLSLGNCMFGYGSGS